MILGEPLYKHTRTRRNDPSMPLEEQIEKLSSQVHNLNLFLPIYS